MTTATAIDILPADVALAPAFAEIFAELHRRAFAAEGDDAEDGGATWSAGAFTELLAMPGAQGWIARRDDRPCGFALARSGGGECEIITIGVDPDHRHGGIAAQLLACVLEAALAAQTPVILEVAEDNTAARALYARAGFVEVGRRRNYYRRAASKSDASADALILRWEG